MVKTCFFLSMRLSSLFYQLILIGQYHNNVAWLINMVPYYICTGNSIEFNDIFSIFAHHMCVHYALLTFQSRGLGYSDLILLSGSAYWLFYRYITGRNFDYPLRNQGRKYGTRHSKQDYSYNKYCVILQSLCQLETISLTVILVMMMFCGQELEKTYLVPTGTHTKLSNVLLHVVI